MFEALLTPTRERWQLIAATGFAGLLFAVGLSHAAGKPKPPPPAPVNPAIVYEIPTNNGVNLAIANADGTNQRVILSNGANNVFPSWNPNGNQIVFVSNLPSPGIYRLGINRSTGQAVGSPDLIIPLNTDFLAASPVWSPVPTIDASYKIAYVDTPQGEIDYDVYLVDPDTKISFNLTSTPDVNEAHVRWSPDATQLVVNHGAENNTHAPYDVEILTLGITSCLPDQTVCETSPRQSLVQQVSGSPLINAEWILAPAWGNTGQEIAVSVLMPGDANGDIWIIPVDNPQAVWNLTVTNAANPPDRHETTATWSPDDSQIMHLARSNLCNSKDRNFQGIVLRNVTEPPSPPILFDGCKEKILIKDGRRPNWWRGLQ